MDTSIGGDDDVGGDDDMDDDGNDVGNGGAERNDDVACVTSELTCPSISWNVAIMVNDCQRSLV